jgi:hypothetical protein
LDPKASLNYIVPGQTGLHREALSKKKIKYIKMQVTKYATSIIFEKETSVYVLMCVNMYICLSVSVYIKCLSFGGKVINAVLYLRVLLKE